MNSDPRLGEIVAGSDISPSRADSLTSMPEDSPRFRIFIGAQNALLQLEYFALRPGPQHGVGRMSHARPRPPQS